MSNKPAPVSITAALGQLNGWFVDHGFTGMCDDERACALDVHRCDEAIGMIDDWRARVGAPLALCLDASRAVRLRAIAAAETDRAALLALCREWIGHDEHNDMPTAEALAGFLREYVQEVYDNESI